MPSCRSLVHLLTFAASLSVSALGQTTETAPSVTPAAPSASSTEPKVEPGTPPPAQQASPTVQPNSQGPVISLEECVARALDKNFDLRIQHFTTESAKETLNIAKGTFDPALQLSTSRFHSRSPTSTSILDDNGNIVRAIQSESDGDSTRLGVSQQLPTGTSLSVSRALDRSKSMPARSTPNPAYDSDVALTVRQPLLRNAGTRVTRAALERARLGVNIANLDFRSAVLTVVRNVESAYYGLAFAREQLNVRRFSLDVANRLLEENRSRRTTGVATDLDVLQAEVQVANARRNVLLAEQQVHEREDALLSEIDPFGFNHSLGDIRLSDDPNPEINAERSYKLARDNTPEYLSAKITLEQLKIDADVARQNRLPTLDLDGTVGYSAREDSYTNAARRTWDGKGYNWELGATLTFPWGLRADRARYRQSKNALGREEVRLQQIEQSILLEVRSAVRSVETNLESLRISALATQLSQRQFDLEKARYDAGLSTFRRVQESQADLDNARVSELQARVTLRNALADLSRIEGTSLGRYHIQLQE